MANGVAEPGQPVPERLDAKRVEAHRRGRAGPVPRTPGPGHVGMNQEAELVDEPAAQQRAGQRAAAVDAHYPRSLPLTERP